MSPGADTAAAAPIARASDRDRSWCDGQYESHSNPIKAPFSAATVGLDQSTTLTGKNSLGRLDGGPATCIRTSPGPFGQITEKILKSAKKSSDDCTFKPELRPLLRTAGKIQHLNGKDLPTPDQGKRLKYQGTFGPKRPLSNSSYTEPITVRWDR
jgi:hypothetical protein